MREIGAAAGGVNYTYDGDGNRLEKVNQKFYWYGAGTEILDESDTSGNFTNEYVFFGGKRVAMRNVSSGTIYYYAEDMLGSSPADPPGSTSRRPGRPRSVQARQTSPCGVYPERSRRNADFYPFGGERIVTNSCTQTQNYKFEGKERDTETGNDDFGARYYSSRMGRWLSADWSSVPVPVPYANLSNPQTLNLYPMVRDNPETFADLDGHCCTWSASSIADWTDPKISAAVSYVQEKSVASGSPTLAASATFVSGVVGDVAKGFTNLLRTGESIGSLPANASQGQVITALAEEGGRVGGTILLVAGAAGGSTPATGEQGAVVASEIGRSRVTLDNGSQVDLTGDSHFEKTTGQDVPTPHIKDPVYNTNPATGQTFQNGYGPTRPATVADVNAAATTAGANPPVTIPTPLPVPNQDHPQ